MTGLVDCNNFFVSCERVFNPALRGKPVIVLSNNDGCAVALSNEAKALGLRRGDPYFKVRRLCEAKGVKVLSGNHRLYGDMSSRVMAVLGSLVPEIEEYSVDEAFLKFDGIDPGQIADFGREIIRKVRRITGIPASLGIAPTKTLAKVAARFAKKYPGYHSVCRIVDDEARRKALSLTPIADVWGVGRKLRIRFRQIGIDTALQYADMPREVVEGLVNVTGCRTWRELNGEPCIEIDEVEPSRQQICCSRSFGKMLETYDQLRQAVALFATIVSRKLREQKSVAASITVYIHTNSFRDDLSQYCNSAQVRLSEATADTSELAAAAATALAKVYCRGYKYKKAGVIITEIIPAMAVRRSLFIGAEVRERRQRLMNVLDNINTASVTRDAIHIASYQPAELLMRTAYRSRLYSTRFNDIITINCNDRH